MSTTISLAATGQAMAARGESVHPAGAAIGEGHGAGAPHIEAVGGTRFQAEKLAHDMAPFVAMGAQSRPLFQVPDQPMGHLVGHHFGQEGVAILVQQDGIEAQPTAAEVGLARALAAQVAPDSGAGQVRMHLTAEPPGRLHLALQAGLELAGIQGGEVFGGRGGQRGNRHGC